MTLSMLQREVTQRSRESFHPVYDWSLIDYACCLGEEVGEVQGKIKRIRRLADGADKAYNKDVSEFQLIDETGKELADVVIYCCLLAERLGISLEAAVIQKFNEVSDRVGSDRKLLS